MCRAGVGRLLCEDKAVWSSYSKTWIMVYYVMFNCHVRDVMSCLGCHAWAPGLSNYYF